MLMKIEPLVAAIKSAKDGLIENANGQSVKVAYLSPQGKVLDQAGVEEIASRDRLVLLCGRYQGIDQRVIDQEVDEEWSIGDFVISGGELAAMILVDAVTTSARSDRRQRFGITRQFSNGLLHWPEYTKPKVFNNRSVPSVLLSGDHKAIQEWRLEQSLVVTSNKRPDLMNEEDQSKKHSRSK